MLRNATSWPSRWVRVNSAGAAGLETSYSDTTASGPTWVYSDWATARRGPSSSICASPEFGSRSAPPSSLLATVSTIRSRPSTTEYTRRPSFSTISPSSTLASWVLVDEEAPLGVMALTAVRIVSSEAPVNGGGTPGAADTAAEGAPFTAAAAVVSVAREAATDFLRPPKLTRPPEPRPYGPMLGSASARRYATSPSHEVKRCQLTFETGALVAAPAMGVTATRPSVTLEIRRRRTREWVDRNMGRSPWRFGE